MINNNEYNITGQEYNRTYVLTSDSTWSQYCTVGADAGVFIN